MSNGLRSMPRYLNDDEIEEIYKEIDAIKADRNVFDFRLSKWTSYFDEIDMIAVGGNVYPSAYSTKARDLLSVRAALAHEYYGHRRFRNTKVEKQSWNDEFRASYYAAVNTPNLSDKDRSLLIQDAIDRAKEAGVNIRMNDTMRRLLYGY